MVSYSLSRSASVSFHKPVQGSSLLTAPGNLCLISGFTILLQHFSSISIIYIKQSMKFQSSSSVSHPCTSSWNVKFYIKRSHYTEIVCKCSESSEKVPSSMLKMCGFISSCICAKSHTGQSSPFKHSIVSNDSVCGHRRP